MSNPEESKNEYLRDHESEINIESIISAPLIAVSKANTMMLSGQTRFLLDYCFVQRKTENSQHPVYDPVMINLSMTRSGVKLIEDSRYPQQQTEIIEQKEVIIAVPLLSLLSMNSIAIEKIKVDFNLDITSITSYKNVSSDGVTVIEKKAQLNGKLSPDQPSGKGSGEDNHRNSTYKKLAVQIEAGSLPLPPGILNLLDLYSKNIYPTQIK